MLVFGGPDGCCGGMRDNGVIVSPSRRISAGGQEEVVGIASRSGGQRSHSA